MDTSKEIHAVTGAFGYSGKYITKKLLELNKNVITLTNSFNRRNPYGDRVSAFPFNFDKPEKLVESLANVKVLYNTYWVRFNHKNFTHETAVQNTFQLIDACKKAGVERFVHISITNPSLDSPLEYFSGKARIEKHLMDSKLSYAILRPTVLFGKEDILINNIAWFLRHFPIFGTFGFGEYKLQPIYVDDLAALCVQYGEIRDNTIVDAIGPETYSYKELAETIGKLIGFERIILPLPDFIGFILGIIIGWLKNDVTITWEEIIGLKSNLLFTNSPPIGQTKLSDWIRKNADQLGRRYANELSRRNDLYSEYTNLS